MFCYSDSIEETEQLRKGRTRPGLGHVAPQPSEKEQVFTRFAVSHFGGPTQHAWICLHESALPLEAGHDR